MTDSDSTFTDKPTPEVAPAPVSARAAGIARDLEVDAARAAAVKLDSERKLGGGGDHGLADLQRRALDAVATKA